MYLAATRLVISARTGETWRMQGSSEPVQEFLDAAAIFGLPGDYREEALYPVEPGASNRGEVQGERSSVA